MNFDTQVSLAPLTTFHIGGPAKFFCTATTVDELQQAVTWAREHREPLQLLGGGSNVLVHDRGYSGLVINFRPKGLSVVAETEREVELQIAAGEVWDEVVQLTVERGWWGMENLSHIPGLVGGFAVQNVGAYGQEASQVLTAVEAIDLETGQPQTFNKAQCSFSYRQSIFNTIQKNRYVIVSVRVRLSKQPRPNLNYGDVKRYFAEREIAQPSQEQIRQAITEIRDRKFPFPTQARDGNAGSFFRGPILRPEQIEYLFQKLATNFGTAAVERLHEMSDRLMVEQGMKTPTAFLIELCGLKGLQHGGAKVHLNHAAIVLNATGQATAADVTALFTQVGQAVHRQTGVMLHIEPELIGFTPAETEQLLDSVIGDDIIT